MVTKTQYKGTNAFGTRGYVIDYTKKSIVVEQNTTFWSKFYDYTFMIGFQILLYIALFYLLLLGFTYLLQLSTELTVYIWNIGLIIIIIFFIIFGAYYMKNNTKRASDIQMLLETPIFGLSEPKKLIIQLNNNKKVMIYLDWYWKYNLTFKGECADHIEKIVYITRGAIEDNIKIIKFTKPVSGTIIFEYQNGTISGIEIE